MFSINYSDNICRKLLTIFDGGDTHQVLELGRIVFVGLRGGICSTEYRYYATHQEYAIKYFSSFITPVSPSFCARHMPHAYSCHMPTPLLLHAPCRPGIIQPQAAHSSRRNHLVLYVHALTAQSPLLVCARPQSAITSSCMCTPSQRNHLFLYVHTLTAQSPLLVCACPQGGPHDVAAAFGLADGLGQAPYHKHGVVRVLLLQHEA